MVLDINKHKNILVNILKDIYTDTSIGSVLGLKGGTALYFFYNLSRFSIDLDFDLLNKDKKEEVFEKVGEIVKKYGEIKNKKDKKNTLFFLISYSRDSKNIKVEINKRNFGSQYELKNYLGISMLVMKPEDMFANKLVAMTERSGVASRDLFDVYFCLVNNWDINKEIVEKRTKIDFAGYLKKCIKFVEDFSERSSLSGMGEFLGGKEKTWVRNNLKKYLLFQLKLRLENEQS